MPVVEEISKFLSRHDFVEKVEVAGSYRRAKETIGDLDFLVVSSQPQKVMDVFTRMKDVKDVLAKGTTKSSVRLSNNMQVDLRVVQKKEFGSALLYFIGGKEHNIELRKSALKQGYTLSEYGLFSVKGKNGSPEGRNRKSTKNWGALYGTGIAGKPGESLKSPGAAPCRNWSPPKMSGAYSTITAPGATEIIHCWRWRRKRKSLNSSSSLSTIISAARHNQSFG